ncbi:hypothetical protein [Egbenema bharatensis]|uniref:hypothetical protein n=1 Tax=Egbenema bharatensis TaxID=3463334 RepID=UPI003A89614E
MTNHSPHTPETERSTQFTQSSAHSNLKQPPFARADQQTALPPARSRWRKLIIYLSTLSITASLGAGSGLLLLQSYQIWMAKRQQAETRILNQASRYRQQGEFDRCIETTQQLPEHRISLLIQQSCEEQRDQEKLKQADQLAFVQGQFAMGISLAQEITSPALQEPVSQFIRRATQRMMTFMEDYYREGRIDDAIHVARAIDDSNPLYLTVQSRILRMQSEWSAQSQLFDMAQAQFSADELDAADQSLQSITHPYWRKQSQRIQDAVENRRQTLEAIVADAEQALEQGNFDRAIARANSLPQTEPWSNTKAEILTEAKRLEDRQFFYQTLALIVVFFLFILVAFPR